VKKYFHIWKPIQAKAGLQVLDELVWPINATDLTSQIGLIGDETGLTAQTTGDTNLAIKDDSITKVEDQDWRVPIISYLKMLVAVQRGIFGIWHSNMFLIDDELYRWTTEDLLLKCLNSDQARVVMRKVHEGISGIHQSAPGMKGLFRRVRFFITLPWCLIVSSSIRVVKNVSGLMICRWCLLLWCILISNYDLSEVEDWSSLVRLNLHSQRCIASC
jgi:hypothetical protein